jgi:hypothetical protein
MRSRILITIIAAAMAAIPVLGLAAPASASTQTVRFRAGSFHCTNGVYGISHVEISGTSSAPYANGTWSGPSNTQTASVSINGIPPSGGAVDVVVTYHCNVKVGWWTFAGYGEPATGTRWVYGWGWQPTYTI